MVARNAVPVVGVYALGWSSGFALFVIWFDGITALAAMLGVATAVVIRDDPDPFKPPEGLPRLPAVVVAPLFWLFPFLILGFPYVFPLGAIHAAGAFEEGFWTLLWQDTGMKAVLGALLASNIAEHLLRGGLHMSQEELKLEFDWELHMHLARIAAICMVAFILPLGGIAVVAAALAYVEIYPMRTLHILGGTESLDPANERRSLD